MTLDTQPDQQHACSAQACIREGVRPDGSWVFLALKKSGPAERDQLTDLAQKAVLQGLEIRQQFQAYTGRLLEIIGNPENLDHRKLRKSDGTVRKPRVMLWAEVNGKGTLHVLWEPSPDSAGGDRFNAYTGGSAGDFLQWGALFHGYSVPRNTVLRLLEREYALCAQGDSGHEVVREASEFLSGTIQDCLNEFLRALAAVADVQVLDWIYFGKGGLTLEPASTRVGRAQNAERESAQRELAQACAEYEESLASLNLPGGAEQYDQLKAQAKGSAALSRLIWEVTGKRCTSLKTERFERLRAHFEEASRRHTRLP